MTYTVLKPFNSGGKRHRVGDTVGGDHIDPKSAPWLARSGYIAQTKEIDQTEFSPCLARNEGGHITIPIMEDESVLEATVSSRSVVEALTTMQKNVEEATKDIMKSEDMDALLILEVADSRRGVQKAAGERRGHFVEQACEKLKDFPLEEDGEPGEKEGRADG